MNSFTRKNDIGVSIEYTIVGTYKEDNNKYMIYTDFVDDASSPSGIRLFVAKKVNNELVDVDPEKKKEIISKLHKSFKGKLSS